MIRFAQSDYLTVLLLLIPALAGLFWFAIRSRKRNIGLFVNPGLFPRLAGTASTAKQWVKFGLTVAAAGMVTLALANPQIGTRMEEVKREGIDLFIALDVSNSMKAEDLKPNRIEKARLEIRSLIDRLRGDRIGLVVFAGEAYTQCPLTTDYGAAYLFLDVVNSDVVPVQGTSIGSAIQRCLDSFDFENPTSKVIVIITDGEDTEGDAFEAAREAAERDVKIYTIGMGSPAGSPIPLYNAAGRQTDFKRDRSGNVVVSKLDEISLQQIAELAGGEYFRASNSQDELDEIYEDINALDKQEFDTTRFTDYEDRFQILLAIALLFLLVE
ncbi:MAG: VWA domain-containing protein, partial [Ignavibacteria bacterium]|nr:VWA domain-containing protein [Ignavibacteria bacterium]